MRVSERSEESSTLAYCKFQIISLSYQTQASRDSERVRERESAKALKSFYLKAHHCAFLRVRRMYLAGSKLLAVVFNEIRSRSQLLKLVGIRA